MRLFDGKGMSLSPDLDQWGREVPAPASRHICPPHHPHGQKRCLDTDACACEVCEEARDTRRLERRRKDLQKPAERPVSVRWGTPTKKAPERPAWRPNKLQTYKVNKEPVQLPPGSEHGNAGYTSSARCRCDTCRKAHSAYQAKYRAAKALGLTVQEYENRPPRHQDQEPKDLPAGRNHGERYAYKRRDCRCAECREWSRVNRAELAKRKAESDDA